MKKALVYIKEVDGRSIGDIGMVMEASEMDAWNHQVISNGNALKIEVPIELEGVPDNELKGLHFEAADEFWSDGVTTYTDSALIPMVTIDDVLVQDPTFVHTEAVIEHWEIVKGDGFIAYDKGERIGDKFSTLNTEVVDQMKTVYNTGNPDSAVANYLTWQSMISSPEKFRVAGLFATMAKGGLNIGDGLDTDQKIIDYATELINDADDYAVWREQKIQTYIVEKSAIESE